MRSVFNMCRNYFLAVNTCRYILEKVNKKNSCSVQQTKKKTPYQQEGSSNSECSHIRKFI